MVFNKEKLNLLIFTQPYICIRPEIHEIKPDELYTKYFYKGLPVCTD